MMKTPRAARAGFTLIEVVIALVILGLVVLAMSSSAGTLIRAASDDRRDTQAAASADERITKARQWPDYASLDTLDRVEANTPQAGWTRTTDVTHVTGSGNTDYKRITVTVSGNGLAHPVTRTITLAAP
jgi:prepilin-type N-terminal cleavage/methylation domain-containing protein